MKISSEEKKIGRTEKPPLGTMSYYISSCERINDLTGAIQRYLVTKNYKAIKTWAREIIYQCDLMEKMSKQEVDDL